MSLPRFLIIGSMKSGTTTLYQDLDSNPSVFFPTDKEPADLASDAVLEPEGRGRYEERYSGMSPGQVAGDASTDYSKLPHVPGVPQRAATVFGGEVQVLYLVRHPIDRMLSHLNHELRRKTSSGRSFPTDDPRFLDYSRYGMQIAPWVDCFGREGVHVIHFESYVADRIRTVSEICELLGVRPRPELVAVDEVFNRADEPMVMNGFWRWLRDHSVYQEHVRPRLTAHTRRWIRSALLPSSETPSVDADPVQLRKWWDELQPDLELLSDLTGFDPSVWAPPP